MDDNIPRRTRDSWRILSTAIGEKLKYIADVMQRSDRWGEEKLPFTLSPHHPITPPFLPPPLHPITPPFLPVAISRAPSPGALTRNHRTRDCFHL